MSIISNKLLICYSLKLNEAKSKNMIFIFLLYLKNNIKTKLSNLLIYLKKN